MTTIIRVRGVIILFLVRGWWIKHCKVIVGLPMANVLILVLERSTMANVLILVLERSTSMVATIYDW
jgi:hypothetical protein